MKKVLLGALASAAIFACDHAGAADLPAGPVYKAPIPVAAVNDWSGFYAGASVGARWSDPQWTTNCAFAPCTPVNAFAALATANPIARFDDATVRVGGYFGYNWQLSPRWVTGLEADIAWGNGRRTMAGIPGGETALLPPQGDSSSIREGWDGSVRGRLGFLVTPAVLLYGTGGLAWQRIDVELNCTLAAPLCVGVPEQGTFSTTRAGWTVGAGVEGMLSGNWLVRAEYRYADYGTLHHAFFVNTPVAVAPPASATIDMSAQVRTNTVMLGLAYKFGPLFAR